MYLNMCIKVKMIWMCFFKVIHTDPKTLYIFFKAENVFLF